MELKPLISKLTKLNINVKITNLLKQYTGNPHNSIIKTKINNSILSKKGSLSLANSHSKDNINLGQYSLRSDINLHAKASLSSKPLRETPRRGLFNSYISTRQSLFVGNRTLHNKAAYNMFHTDISGEKVMSMEKKSDLDLHDLIARRLFKEAINEYKTYIITHLNFEKPIKVFISHAWGSYDNWLNNFVYYLKLANIEAAYDKHEINRNFDNKNYTNINDFVATMTETDRIIIIGTQKYYNKATTKNTDLNQREPGLVSEFRHIRDKFSTFNEIRRRRLLPILLEGEMENVFPPLLVEDKDIAIYFKDSNHFLNVFEILNSIYNLSPVSQHYKAVENIKGKFYRILQQIDNQITEKTLNEYLAAKQVSQEEGHKYNEKKIDEILQKEINKIKSKPMSTYVENEILKSDKEITTPDANINEKQDQKSKNKKEYVRDESSNFNRSNGGQDNTRENQSSDGNNYSKKNKFEQFKNFIKTKNSILYEKIKVQIGGVIFLTILFYILKKIFEFFEEKPLKINNIEELSGILNKKYYITRGALLDELKNHIEKLAENNLLTEVTITGISGIGKTSFIIDFLINKMRKNNSNKNNSITYLLNANKHSIVQDYYKFAESILGYELISQLEDENQIIARVNTKLLENPNFVLVFDNVSDFHEIEKYIPSQHWYKKHMAEIKDLLKKENYGLTGSNIKWLQITELVGDKLIKGLKGNIIYIANKSDSNIPKYVDEFKLSPLDCESEALSLLNKILNDKNEDRAEQKRILINHLGGLPMALKIAAYSIQRHGTIDSYISNLKDKYSDENYKSLPDCAKESEYEAIQESVIKLALEEILKNDQNAKQVLLFCNQLATTYIPYYLLREYVKRKHDKTDLKKEDNDDWKLLLENYSLLNYTEKLDSYILPAVVRNVIQLNKNNDDTDQIKLEAIVLLKDLLTDKDNWILRKDFNIKLALVPHAKKLLKYESKFRGLSEVEFVLAKAGLYKDLSILYLQTGMPHEAEAMLEGAKNILVKALNCEITKANAEKIYHLLTEKASKNNLMSQFAETLYMLARAYFYRQDQETLPKELEEYLNTAIELRKLADNKSNDNKAPIYERSGKVFNLILKAEACSNKNSGEALSILEQAEDLLRNLKNERTNDKYHQAVCCEYLAKIFRLRAELTNDQLKRDDYYKKAIHYIKGKKDKNNKTEVSEEGALTLLKTYGDGRNSPHRLAKYYNTLGFLYLSRGKYIVQNNRLDNEKTDLYKANRKFSKAIKEEIKDRELIQNLDQRKADFPSADAYFGLAKDYHIQKDLSKAMTYIDQSIRIHVSLKHNIKNPQLREVYQEANEICKDLIKENYKIGNYTKARYAIEHFFDIQKRLNPNKVEIDNQVSNLEVKINKLAEKIEIAEEREKERVINLMYP